MTAFAFPTAPCPINQNFNWTDNRVLAASALSDAVQVMARAGGYWEVDVQLPPLTTAEVRAWFAALKRAQTEPVYFSPPYSSALLSGGNPGAPLVNGAGQVGTTLVTDGWTNGYVIQEGDYLSFNNGTFDELHTIKYGSPVTVDGLGNATLTLAEPIQRTPPDNAVIRISNARANFLHVAPAVGFDARLAGLHGLRFKLRSVTF
ncbi:MAG: hypothetical protein Q9M33_06770 [Robiginitomaculum sp.]|nr:hypothetical protein [Robiginitomaculum sp.]